MKYFGKNHLNCIGLILISVLVCSCEKFLDVKPDKSLSVPHTARDLQALLDFETRMNHLYPAAGDIASDDYYMYPADWQKLNNPDDRNSYIWDKSATAIQDWQYTYQRVFDANVVLDHIDKISNLNAGTSEYHSIKGSALFFRGYSLFQATEVFTLPYNRGNASITMGIPLRLTSDVNDKTVRATQETTFNQILKDLTEASKLLPSVTSPKTRPGRAAAFATLARVYLVTGDYAKSGAYADSCLQIQGDLLDYNTLSTTAANPFIMFNKEVVFHAVNKSNMGIFRPNVARVDTLLYSMFGPNDLRKALFFIKNPDNSYQFKGSYEGTNAAPLFSGIATDEVYLIRAECYARQGDVTKALEMLNKLLVKRWKAGTFVPFAANTAEEALKIILEERRKELVFRGGLRWSDLRRLNNDPAYAKTLTRKFGAQEYTLPPNDKRYAFLIPISVITQSGIKQNER